MSDRGRVPFALVGVLLVLTSTTIAVTTVTQQTNESPHVDAAMDGTTAAAVTELRGAADDAAQEASAAPVTKPNDTPAGRALDDDHPFRDALKLRIYLRVVERIDGTETTRGPVTATAALPTVEPTTDGYRRAIGRVDIERAGEDDAAMRVKIDGVRLSAVRDGRTVATVERSPEFVVANPVLALHDRTEQFERRANAPVTRRGLGQRLTTRLYPIAWMRGYAQYGGAPISTVLGTRHVEFATNGALLAEQRAVFGEADPDGDRGVSAAGGRVVNTDIIAGVGGDEEWHDEVLGSTDEFREDRPAERPVGTWFDEPEDPSVTVGVNASADHAFADAIGVRGRDRVGSVVDRAHTVESRVVISSDLRGRSRWGGVEPGGNWTLASMGTRKRTTIDRVSNWGPHDMNWETVDGGTFDVTRTRTTTRRWKHGNETKMTSETRRRTYRVEVAAQARTVPVEGVPAGRLDGHLRGATDRAVDDALDGVGGLDGAARSAARGSAVRSTGRATASPAIDRATLESDLGTVRDRSREISVTLPAPAVGTGRANPPEQLRETMADRRGELLIDADRTTRERAIRAARLEYLDSLDSELETRTGAFDDTSAGIGDAIGEHLDADRLDGALGAHRAASNPSAAPMTDPAGNLTMAVDTAPSYLTTSEVTRDRIDERGGGTIYPLSTRSINVFSSPHGQVSSGIFDRIPFLDTERVPLSTAARTLAAADGYDRHGDLEREVESSTRHVRGELVAELVDIGVSEHDARRALRTDASTAEEALMLTNGTTVERAAESIDGPATTERIELRLRTRLDSELEETAARPTEATTTNAQQQLQREYRTKLEDLLADGVEAAEERERKDALGERLGAIPAGLPVAPIPGYWYATANVWYVTIDGQYERFAVRTNRGDGVGSTAYLRDNRTAWVTHGSESKQLGTAEPVSFRTQTAVVVVVPPGPRGVGDTDGEPYKHSPGWES
ncbi:MAG: DUF7286 family protein [Halobacteriota archaeon]|uniref:DUF7286 family protein n=1 Tax=Natronomonas sp. TaxID=2184060 RepID=UPI0039765228